MAKEINTPIVTVTQHLNEAINLAEYEYISAPAVQQRIDLWRHIYGRDVITVRQHINDVWSETELCIDSSAGENVTKSIYKDINKYIDVDMDGSKACLTELFALK